MGLVWGILERHVVTCVEKYPVIKPVPTSNLLQGLLSPLGSESLSESLHKEHYISSCGVLLLLFLTILVYQGSQSKCTYLLVKGNTSPETQAGMCKLP